MQRIILVFWRNGAFIDGDAPDRGTFGVFDTLLADHLKLIHADDHYARLRHDVKAVLGAVEIPAFAGILTAINQLLDTNALTEFARVRTSVTPEMVLIETFPCPDPASLPPLTCAIIEDWPRVAGDPLENCKRLDYTRSLAARDKAKRMSADDAIITNTDGHIACGATSNIFIEENGTLITPPLSEGVLNGIIRKKILNGSLPLTLPAIAGPFPLPSGEGDPRQRRGSGEGIKEEVITRERLQAADSIWLTNSIFGKRRVSGILNL